MARRRSRNPERIDTPRIRALRELLSELDDEELPLARHLATHELARRRGFADEPERQADDEWLRAQLALSGGDLRCREATGRPLRTVREYQQHREPDAPSASAVCKLFDGWGAALSECGLLDVSQPEAELTLRPGSPAKSRGWREDDFVAAVALVMERFRGRLMSQGAYEQAREAMPVELPTTNMMRKALARGEDSQGFWDDVRERAIELILSEPETYPQAHAYRTRLEAVCP